MMSMMGFGFMSAYWLLSVLMLLAAIVLVIWSIFRIRTSSGHSSDEPYDRAIQVLRERYARGEIDREEYLQRLEDLQD
ncbi:putative membrane protein [Alicyclobacillus hesperidum]|uniref:Putative membrane protein n=1 Tax=Alicyclobacillus hesperidum TaxID=89784 RepID=A0A1H2XPM4_9BACL|nr:SHOCT domain-containing protein [Alicyclobacillus hesperidum]SDW94454.1 putative membrane protein [Alicyclobacillus hesperidum]